MSPALGSKPPAVPQAAYPVVSLYPVSQPPAFLTVSAPVARFRAVHQQNKKAVTWTIQRRLLRDCPLNSQLKSWDYMINGRLPPQSPGVGHQPCPSPLPMRSAEERHQCCPMPSPRAPSFLQDAAETRQAQDRPPWPWLVVGTPAGYLSDRERSDDVRADRDDAGAQLAQARVRRDHPALERRPRGNIGSFDDLMQGNRCCAVSCVYWLGNARRCHLAGQ